jgi:hypothetical protein
MAKRKWRASCEFIKLSKNLQNTRHSDFIIYKSYATYVLSGTIGKWRLSHHLSITIGVDLVEKRGCALFSH